MIGTMTVTEFYDWDQMTKVLRIDQADPWIHVAEEVLEQLEERGWAGEGQFKIEARNGTVRYALRIHNKLTHTWVAERLSEWPEQLDQPHSASDG